MTNDTSQIILENFKNYGNRRAIYYDGNNMSYDCIREMIIDLSDKMISINVDSVAICLDNKMNIILLALSCMVAGIPFIVIDKYNPISFLEDILHESNVSTIICEEKLCVENCDYILFSDLESTTVSSNNRLIKSSNKILFYIATSGSTGKSKVAERFSSAFWNDYEEFISRCPYLFGQVAQQYAKLNFSYGLENSLLLLIGGTTLCLAGKSSSIKDLNLMYKEIETNQASVVFWATPIIKLLSKHFKLFEGMPGCIKYIYTGGEPLVVSADLIIELHNRKIILINDYGCSEIGKIFVNPYQIKIRDMELYNMVGIGSPLKGYEAVIMNEDFCEVEEGFLTLKSKERFPYSYVNKKIPTNEIYKNGYWLYNMHDIAKKEENDIIILGRERNSVNISGYRVEFEQVEYAVNQLQEISSCVAMVTYNQYREATMFCFYLGAINSASLRIKLGENLPNYMVPNVFVQVENIFLLPNGKVDREKNYSEFEKMMNIRKNYTGELKWRIYKYLIDIVGGEMEKLDDMYMTSFNDLGIDSLNVADFISTVEDKEKVRITNYGIGTKIKCLKDIVDLVNNSKVWKGDGQRQNEGK